MRSAAKMAIPNFDCEDCIPDWNYKDLSPDHVALLSEIYSHQRRPVDQLACLGLVHEMACFFSARTGIATTAAILFRNLMAMRKSGDYPELKKGRSWDKESGPSLF